MAHEFRPSSEYSAFLHCESDSCFFQHSRNLVEVLQVLLVIRRKSYRVVYIELEALTAYPAKDNIQCPLEPILSVEKAKRRSGVPEGSALGGEDIVSLALLHHRDLPVNTIRTLCIKQRGIAEDVYAIVQPR